jgi:protein-tyrosine kinase
MTRKDFTESIHEAIRLNVLDVSPPGGGKKGKAPPARKRFPVDEKLVVFTDGKSLAAEYFGYLASKIERSLAAKNPNEGKVLLVTGPSRGSGKTLCSLNLARSFSKNRGGGVLFLDADSRAGQAQSYLGFGGGTPLPGLSDVLEMAARAENVLVETGLHDLAFFPSGPFVENQFARTAGKELPLLLDGLRKKYRLVIIDTPPAFPLPEAGILAPLADAALVVLGAGKDGPTQLAQTLEALQGVRVAGVVLNNMPANMEQQSRYGRYGRYYGYGNPGAKGKK